MSRPTRRSLEKEIAELAGTDIDVDDLPVLNLSELIVADEIKSLETPAGEPRIVRLDGDLYLDNGLTDKLLEMFDVEPNE